MEIVTCRGVEKIFGKGASQVNALNGVDFAMEKGEFVALTGASGSGKSTLMHILASVEKPAKGTVTVDGTDVGSLNATEAALYRRRTVGLVYQFYNLIPTLSAEQNILMPLLLDQKKPDREFLSQLTATLNIQDKLQALPHQLSGGQQQRVAIARALIARPALLLADEPTGSLDQQNSREILRLLKAMNRELGQTVLLVTHDPNVASEADRILTIADGKIVSSRG